METKTRKTFTTLLGITNSLFLVYYVVLSVFNRMHFDDVHFMWMVDEKGVLGFVKDIYMRHSGRYFDYLLDGLIAKCTLLTDVYFFWPIVYYAIGIWFTWIFAKTFFNNEKVMAFLAVVLGYNLYILTSTDTPTFFWLCAVTYYTFGPAMLALLAMLNRKKYAWYDYLLIGFLFLMVGGTYEVYTPIALLLLGFMVMYYHYANEWKWKPMMAMPEVRHLLVGIIVVVLLWLINILGPGNYIRMDNVGEAMIVHPQSVVEFGKGVIECIVMFTYFSAFYLPHYICLFVVFAVLGLYNGERIDRKKSRKYIMIGIGVFVVLFLIGTVPVVYLYNGFGIYRYWTLYVYMLSLLLCGLGYIIGSANLKHLSAIKIISYIGLIGIIGSLCISLWYDSRSAYRFASSVDARKEFILDKKKEGNTEVVQVRPYDIPYTIDSKYLLYKCIGREKNIQPVLYYYSDAEVEPNAYMGYVKRAYHLDFDFVTTEETKMP